MTEYRLDEEFAQAIVQLPSEFMNMAEPPANDVHALREVINFQYTEMGKLAPPAPDGVNREDVSIPVGDGVTLEARWYTKWDARPGSAVVYAHGGGQVAGTLDHYDRRMRVYVTETSVPILSVGYRVAPEGKGQQLSEDVFAGVLWLNEHADRLGIDRARIAVMGDSGGGGLAAAAAVLGRDRGIPIAQQILIYAMLDDTVDTASEALAPFLAWTAPMNATSWNARSGGPVSETTSPARLIDARGLAAAYVEVGDLDLMRDESIAYAMKLSAADVPLELHVHPGTPHAYEWLDENAGVTQRSLENRYRVLRSL
ncbi:alpha/beta hydrolase fold domain-containing protein [Curtobacterium sp. MCSS17_015]|uniref:alpha/beta hydrolase fold domain-containing protein n=1 Tax=Curtobacterium sp. MCSS17_015 TaxID=2175666 RepID=UPI000DA81E6A|nr:alpha/beta hydrolase fold domain-containing protein [Curtobacterium sp. MCSS17_015]WIB27000.1 alpha/beta hydrolase fold domain-containing protein [Curtobacterium sp. MCSS17_015]